MEKIISALKARQNLGTLLNEVLLKNDQFIIERNGKPMAAVIPVWQFKQWKEKRKAFFRMIDQVRQKNGKVNQKTIESEITEAIAFAKKEEIKKQSKKRR
ncbi:MAG: type II toxin-antitoxin system Phd/YefM family antitoxin [candidate division Zixibacteria bacterium]|nr:type II toxin-antitoxin system Phd/YefM family antitoxin [candidate division Zixibacteria bacterium]